MFSRTGGAWRLGLERVTALLSALDDPQLKYPIFHVAGTNGKGSTVATLYAMLRGAGLRVGRYTSPHLVDFAERIVVDGEPMPHDAITKWLARHEPELVRLGATFFEATTAMALARFADAQVDVAIIEVGLGGRLDATNVVRPIAAAVTQIGFDHTEFLGDSLLAIASEKAGIFKLGVPAIVGETRPEICDRLIELADAAGASLTLATDRDWHVRDVQVGVNGTSFTLDNSDTSTALVTPLVGAFQANNTAVALAMLRAAGGKWEAIGARAPELLHGVRIAGRFHRWMRWLFDVAHNPDGAVTLAENLIAVGAERPIVAVVCVLRDKDWRGILQALARVADRIILTMAPTVPESRAWNLDDVEGWAKSASLPVSRVDDFREALHGAEQSGGTILVTGSFHTVGDAMERLQVDPLAR